MNFLVGNYAAAHWPFRTHRPLYLHITTPDSEILDGQLQATWGDIRALRTDCADALERLVILLENIVSLPGQLRGDIRALRTDCADALERLDQPSNVLRVELLEGLRDTLPVTLGRLLFLVLAVKQLNLNSLPHSKDSVCQTATTAEAEPTSSHPTMSHSCCA